MPYSCFGHMFDPGAGILRLMQDLGNALAGDKHFIMLGGGNPSSIPAMQRIFRERMQAILDTPGEFERIVGNYDGPQGERAFVDALAALLSAQFGWDIGPRNIAITNGSQASFFVLFNLFAGEFAESPARRVLLPLTPEYIGYTDTAISRDIFRSQRPRIERLGANCFKYRVDFDALRITDDIGAVCTSRPTNPTGNVLADDEIRRLMALTATHNVPFIIDGAYGTPFPNIIFSDAQPFWNERMVMCMSLSKLGLPGVRTGIVVANEDIIERITSANAILNLAPGSIGPALALDLVRTGRIIELSREIIMPFYRAKAERAIEYLHTAMHGYPYAVHKAEGAIFLWLWFEDLPITSEQLYQRLKQRGVLVIASENFFPGLAGDWRHRHECIRITYAQDDSMVCDGLRVIAEEVQRAYDGIAATA